MFCFLLFLFEMFNMIFCFFRDVNLTFAFILFKIDVLSQRHNLFLRRIIHLSYSCIQTRTLYLQPFIFDCKVITLIVSINCIKAHLLVQNIELFIFLR
jgi:hypothetical protein